eukprot:TRINITY_DN5119_c2_g1_i1.p1 TRINITY_DN5119_c2_g1~~TRINITY_DN5119_c2_g1_i1.p1  ORF type:complete len:760 (+),score=176.81 TRINITY_DN5119_c2_g1_i1:211-2490(+)
MMEPEDFDAQGWLGNAAGWRQSDMQFGVDGSPATVSRVAGACGSAASAPSTLQEAPKISAAWTQRAHAPLFPNEKLLKEKMRQSLREREYDVRDLYKDSGIWQYIARSNTFETVTLLAIGLNALWIAVDTDGNTAELLSEAPLLFQVAEHSFCTFFVIELAIRFLAFRRKMDGLVDPWFLFDGVLVVMMVVETWLMTILLTPYKAGIGDASILKLARLMRLTRMARMVRLLRAMPELMILVKGMIAATRSVFFTLCLLLIVIYIFGILFRQLARDNIAMSQKFTSVPESMYILMMQGAFLENVFILMNDLRAESALLAWLFFFFLLLASLTMMNMLIGVLCEVVSAVASCEKESLEGTFVKAKLMEIFISTYPELRDVGIADIAITREQYTAVIQQPAAAKVLREVGVDVVGLIDLTDLFFERQQDHDDDDNSEHEMLLSFGDLMESVLELRGSNTATVKDIMDLRKFFRNKMDGRLGRIESALFGSGTPFGRSNATFFGGDANRDPRSPPPPRRIERSLFGSPLRDAASMALGLGASADATPAAAAGSQLSTAAAVAVGGRAPGRRAAEEDFASTSPARRWAMVRCQSVPPQPPSTPEPTATKSNSRMGTPSEKQWTHVRGSDGEASPKPPSASRSLKPSPPAEAKSQLARAPRASDVAKESPMMNLTPGRRIRWSLTKSPAQSPGNKCEVPSPLIPRQQPESAPPQPPPQLPLEVQSADADSGTTQPEVTVQMVQGLHDRMDKLEDLLQQVLQRLPS